MWRFKSNYTVTHKINVVFVLQSISPVQIRALQSCQLSLKWKLASIVPRQFSIKLPLVKIKIWGEGGGGGEVGWLLSSSENIKQ